METSGDGTMADQSTNTSTQSDSEDEIEVKL
jgi:hypothetical protein